MSNQNDTQNVCQGQEQIISFYYEDKKIRVIRDEKGELWFVAKDVCEALGMEWSGSQKLSNIPDNWKGVKEFLTPSANDNRGGGIQKLIIINEPALYKLSFRSNKPEADRFTNWVASEVLPAIRKIGTYSLPSAKPRTLILPPEFDSEVRQAVRIARVFGFKGNQAFLSANRMIRNLYGIDCLGLMEHRALICEKQERHLTPTEIGKMLGGISAQKVNKKLEAAGIIESYRDGKNRPKWKPTEKGKKHTILKDTAKKHTDGTPIQQMFLLDSVIGILKENSTS